MSSTRMILIGLILSATIAVSPQRLWGASLPESQPYLLGPGDVLEVNAWNDDSLKREVLVRPDGGISFPLIGDITAMGLTVDKLRETIEGRIREFAPNSPVTVMLKQLGYPRVFVVGKVAKPGIFIMTSSIRVMQALAMAGGLTTFASQDDITVLRDEGQEQKTFRFRYSDIERGKNLDQNIVLKAGDTIVVP